MFTLDDARVLVRARSHGRCEACFEGNARLDVHHRQARAAGGVHGAAAVVANSPGNLLALCRVCHDMTEQADEWQACIGLGLRIPHLAGVDPREVPALLRTVNGYGWWQLTEDAGYRWVDRPAQLRLTLDDIQSGRWSAPEQFAILDPIRFSGR